MANTEGSSLTSLSLVERVRACDAQAWDRFAKLYGPLVYRWGRLAGLQPCDAADVSQEVFRAVAKGIGGFRHGGPGTTLRGWLCSITRNAVRAHFRQLKRHPRGTGGSAAQQRIKEVPTLLDELEDPSGSDASTSLAQRALRLMRQDFDERTWQAFWRLAISNDPVAEIAADLKMSAGGVRQAKYRVLARLRSELDGFF